MCVCVCVCVCMHIYKCVGLSACGVCMLFLLFLGHCEDCVFVCFVFDIAQLVCFNEVP